MTILKLEQSEPDDDDALFRIESAERDVREIAAAHERGDVYDWQGERLRSAARHVREYFDRMPPKLQHRAREVACNADTLGGVADSLYHIGVVTSGWIDEYASVTAAMAAAKRIRAAWEYFKREGSGVYTPAQYREGLERCAWHRARKRLDEADVAAGGGNEKKAARLRGEAVVMLRQDWAKVFPGEDPPTIEGA